MAKKFLTLREQLDFLKKEKNIDYDLTDTVRLMREGYFNVITNYKSPFIIGNSNEGYTIFEKGTKLKHILALKDFDDSLRIIILEYIVKAEQEIRAVVSYLFDKYNNSGAIKWDDPKAYDLVNIPVAKIQSLIRRINNDMENNDNEDINEYIKKHQYIPTWAMIQAISFSTLQLFIRDCKKEVKNEIVKIYQFKDSNKIYSFELFDKSLNLLREVRNKCAHNERTYCFNKDNSRIVNEEVIEYLKKINELTYPNECRIVNLFIYMRYYLTDSEYAIFANRISNKLYDLRKSISRECFKKVLNIMGVRHIDFFKYIIKIEILKIFKF